MKKVPFFRILIFEEGNTFFFSGLLVHFLFGWFGECYTELELKFFLFNLVSENYGSVFYKKSYKYNKKKLFKKKKQELVNNLIQENFGLCAIAVWFIHYIDTLEVFN